MEKKPVIIPENINLFHLKIVKSDIISQSSYSENIDFKINAAHTTMHNLPLNRLKIGLIIDIIGEINAKEIETKAHFNIDFHFQIKELNNFYTLDKKNLPVFSSALITTLLGISFSTARGIIYERLNDTDLEGVILPVVSPQEILKSRINNSQ